MEPVAAVQSGQEKTREFMPGDCSMAVMGREGDTKTVWNPNNQAEVDNARETFNNLKKKGYVAFKVKADGEKGEILYEFDQKAEKMILAPPMHGG